MSGRCQSYGRGRSPGRRARERAQIRSLQQDMRQAEEGYWHRHSSCLLFKRYFTEPKLTVRVGLQNNSQDHPFHVTSRLIAVNLVPTFDRFQLISSYVFVTVRGWGQQDIAFRCLFEADKALVRATSVTYKEAWELPPSKRGGESDESKQIVLDPSIPVTPSRGSVSGDSTPTEHDYKELMDLADRLGIVVVDHNPPGKWGVLTLKGGEMLYIAIIVFMSRALHLLCMHHTTSCMPLLVIIMAYIRHCCSFVYRFVLVYSTL